MKKKSNNETFNIKNAIKEFRDYLIKKYTLKWKKTYIPFDILKYDATHYMLLSERTDGKSYIIVEFIMWLYVNYTYAGALIRRWDEDIKGSNGFDQIQNYIGENKLVIERTKGRYNNLVEEMTEKKYNTIVYKQRRYYLAKAEEMENGEIKTTCDDTFFMITRAINNEEHNRGGGLERVKICFFDEFMTRSMGAYLTNEWILFNNVISTIVRRRNDIIIFMCGNTLNAGYSIYFDEMGINPRQMKKGEIEIYTYGNDTINRPVVAVELIDYVDEKEKKSNRYFAFDNPKLEMITSGKWEIGAYKHIPRKYAPKNVLYTYFIKYKENTFMCEIVFFDDDMSTFTAIHPWTSEIKIKDDTLIFEVSTNNFSYHYRTNFKKPYDEIGTKILWYFKNNLVCYSSNLVGETIHNFLKEI